MDSKIGDVMRLKIAAAGFVKKFHLSFVLLFFSNYLVSSTRLRTKTDQVSALLSHNIIL